MRSHCTPAEVIVWIDEIERTRNLRTAREMELLFNVMAAGQGSESHFNTLQKALQVLRGEQPMFDLKVLAERMGIDTSKKIRRSKEDNAQ